MNNSYSTFNSYLGQRLRGSSEGFTLTELLVVILIIGILLAIALPNFLHQQDKAKDASALSLLNTGYKIAKSEGASTGEYFPSAARVASALLASENIETTATPSHGKITIEQSNASGLHIETLSESGMICSLEAPVSGPIASECSPAPSGPVLASSGVVAGQFDNSGGLGLLFLKSPTFTFQNPTTSVSYQFESSNNGSTWTNVGGAATVSGGSVSGGTGGYSAVPAYIRLKAVASDSNGTSTSYSPVVNTGSVPAPTLASAVPPILRNTYVNPISLTLKIAPASFQNSSNIQQTRYFWEYSTNSGATWTTIGSYTTDPTTNVISSNLYSQRNSLVRVKIVTSTLGGNQTFYSNSLTAISAPSS